MDASWISDNSTTHVNIGSHFSKEPRLIYSTKVDGFSLHRLYLRCQEIAPLILIIRSLENNVF